MNAQYAISIADATVILMIVNFQEPMSSCIANTVMKMTLMMMNNRKASHD